jgi:phosphoribosylformimino-5-aminoimidazole carboxamide ribotide isomerase
MKFRPCIDLHQGLVKQIVGSTLKDDMNVVEGGGDKQQPAEEEGANHEPQQQQQQPDLATNFATTLPSSHYARLYQTDRLTGGHVIMLGGGNDEAARLALSTYPGGLQIGGGITLDNCHTWLAAGASHVIVTSFVFTNGHVRLDRLEALRAAIGKERLVLDLSCRRRPPQRRKKLEDNEDADQVDEEESDDTNYYVVTDKWQTFTNVVVNAATLTQLAAYCDEFLVHGVDVEGLQCGILEDLVQLLGAHSPIPVCYAGGVRSLADLDLVDRLGGGRVDCTVGSALDIFGGALPYADVVAWHHRRNNQEQ